MKKQFVRARDLLHNYISPLSPLISFLEGARLFNRMSNIILLPLISFDILYTLANDVKKT